MCFTAVLITPHSQVFASPLTNQFSRSRTPRPRGLKTILSPLCPLPFPKRTFSLSLFFFSSRVAKGTHSAYSRTAAGATGRNNLELNTLKTVEMTVDLRRSPPALPPLTILNSTVLAVESFRFLGSTISRNLKWEPNINTIIKKAQQRMYFLRQLRKYNLPQELLILFYTAVIKSVLCTSITVWFGSATKLDKNRLQRTVRSAGKIIGANLPTIQDLYTSRVRKRQEKSLQTPHTLDTTYSNSSPLVSATDLCSPKPPDTKTVSSPSPSHYWAVNPLWHCATTLDHYNNHCTITPAIIFISFTLTV